MQKRAWNVKLLLLAGVLAVALITGCGGSNSLTFPVSGKVTDKNGVAMPGVTILFNGVPGATSDMKGNWIKTGVRSGVKVTAQKEGYAFARFEGDNPIPNDPVTRGSQSINFTGYDILTDGFKPNGTVVNKGLDAPEAAYGTGLAGVIFGYKDPITSEDKTVTTDSNGNWAITEDLIGGVEITVQSAPAGWTVMPNKFMLTLNNYTNIEFYCTNKTYSGTDIMNAIAGNATIISGSAGTVMPDELTIGSDNLPIAEVMYLMAKWVALYSNGTSLNGTIPGQVPYVQVSKPDAYTAGKTDGCIFFIGGNDGYYGTAVSLASTIENTSKIPDLIQFNNGWNLNGDGAAKTTETVHIADVISIYARIINWVKNNNVLPNLASIKGMNPPASW